MKTKTVSADIDITIEEAEWVGNFKASFSGCNSMICIQNYSAEVDFKITELDTALVDEDLGVEYNWMGEATVTQSGNVTSNQPDYWIDNSYMSGTFSEVVFGSGLKGTNEIAFESLCLILVGHFDFDCCYEEINNPDFCYGGFALGFVEGIDGTGAPRYYQQFKVVLEGDEIIKSGQCILWVWGRPPDIWGPYTLTIKKKQ